MESGERRTRFDLLPDGQVWKVVLAEGTTSAQTASTTTYGDNGLPLSIANARGHVTGYAYDKRDLLLRRSLRGTTDVSPTCSSCLKFSYDAIGRLRTKAVPAAGMRLDAGVHQQISGFYSSIQPQVTGSTSMSVRQWLSTQSFDAQQAFGQQVLRQFGGL